MKRNTDMCGHVEISQHDPAEINSDDKTKTNDSARSDQGELCVRERNEE